MIKEIINREMVVLVDPEGEIKHYTLSPDRETLEAYMENMMTTSYFFGLLKAVVKFSAFEKQGFKIVPVLVSIIENPNKQAA